MRLVGNDDATRRLEGFGKKCLPSLRRRRAALDSILRHSRFRKVKAEEAGFRLDPRRSPKRVLERHPFDQLTNLFVEFRTADRSLGLPSPVELEALPVPFDDSFRFYELDLAQTDYP
jgi:hypothetical protein